MNLEHMRNHTNFINKKISIFQSFNKQKTKIKWLKSRNSKKKEENNHKIDLKKLISLVKEKESF